MPLPISPIGATQISDAIRPASQSGKPGAFSSVLEGAINAVEQPRADAASQVQGFLSGQTDEIHSVALAVQKADLAFDLGLQVRNKVVDAYQEVMKMQM